MPGSQKLMNASVELGLCARGYFLESVATLLSMHVRDVAQVNCGGRDECRRNCS